jgi:hypothetical protein
MSTANSDEDISPVTVNILGDVIALVAETSDEIPGMFDEVIDHDHVGGGVVVDVPIATPSIHATDGFKQFTSVEETNWDLPEENLEVPVQHKFP